MTQLEQRLLAALKDLIFRLDAKAYADVLDNIGSDYEEYATNIKAYGIDDIRALIAEIESNAAD